LPVTHENILDKLYEECPLGAPSFPNFALFIGKVAGVKGMTIGKDICVSTAKYLLDPKKEY